MHTLETIELYVGEKIDRMRCQKNESAQSVEPKEGGNTSAKQRKNRSTAHTWMHSKSRSQSHSLIDMSSEELKK